MIRVSTVNRPHGIDPAPLIPRFVSRLTAMNPRAIRYRLDGDQLRYEVLVDRRLRGFDRDMMRYIDHASVIPLRFVARTPLFLDSHHRATLDLDDLLNGSSFSFAINMLHILEERLRTPNYETRRRIFNRPHRLAIEKERDYLRGLIRDPTLRYTGERARPNGVYVFTFRSERDYRLEHVFTTGGGQTSSEIIVVQGGQRRTLPEFLGR